MASWARATLSSSDVSRSTFTLGCDHDRSTRTARYVMAMGDRLTHQSHGSSVGVRHRF